MPGQTATDTMNGIDSSVMYLSRHISCVAHRITRMCIDKYLILLFNIAYSTYMYGEFEINSHIIIKFHNAPDWDLVRSG